MRPLFIVLLGFLVSLSAATANQQPKNVRVCVQFIEMPHPVLTELFSGKAESGDVVHEKAMALTKEGKAKLLESSMITTLSGQKATVESIRELIYPTEYNPPGHVEIEGGIQSPSHTPTPRPPLTCPNAFQTRNTGVTLEIEPTVSDNNQCIDLRFIPEIVALSRFDTIMKHTDEWGDASYRQPVFETWRCNTQITLMVGKFEPAATITPKPAELVPATLRKILVFVRCDVLPVGK